MRTKTRQYAFLSLVLIIVTLGIFHLYTSDPVFRTDPLLYTEQMIRHLLRGKVYKHFRNICIDKSVDMHPEFYPFQAKLQAFDGSGRNSKSRHVFKINVLKGVNGNFWQVDIHNANDLPSHWKVFDSVAFFPPYWRDSNQIFLFWSNMLPNSKSVLDWTRNHLATKHNDTAIRNTILFAPQIKKMDQTFRDLIYSLGINNITDFKQAYDNSPICFKHGVFAYTYKSRITTVFETRQYIRQQWERSFAPCKDTYMLIIQRQNTRRLLNIDSMVDVARNYGYANVRTEFFEGLRLREQYAIIRCASVFVAVQGAALSWHSFLPRGATVVEITYEGWPVRYRERALMERPDLNPRVIKCDVNTPDSTWQYYAKRWYNHTGVIDDKMKRRLEKDSYKKLQKKSPVGKSVWKDSDCACKANVFLSAIPKPRVPNVL